MNRNAAALIEQVEAYASLFDRVSVGDRFDGASSAGPIRVTSDAELLEATSAVARVIRLAQAEQVQLTGEIARRSEVRDETSLAKTMGTTGPTELVAQVSGMTRDEAGSLVRFADAVRSREALTGDVLPPTRACVAEAFAVGNLDLTVAQALVRTLRKVDSGFAPFEVDDLERQMIARTQEGYTADELLGWFRQVPSFAHPEGNGPRDENAAANASVTMRRLENGLTRWTLDLDPLTNGFFTTALEANTAERRNLLVESDQPVLDAAEEDHRPLKRRRVDGVRLLSKRAIKSDDGQQAGTAVTMLVTIDETALRTGIGAATLPGCMDIISAATARMLAADAEIIPVVLGSKSQVLDLGTGTRFFTEAQRRVMALRDGGCAGPNCDAPLAWCDGAHIRPAGYGPTSIENGILLCWRCHLLLDQHGWQVERTAERWWWTPPPWIDRTGRKRPGGRIPALDLAP